MPGAGVLELQVPGAPGRVPRRIRTWLRFLRLRLLGMVPETERNPTILEVLLFETNPNIIIYIYIYIILQCLKGVSSSLGHQSRMKVIGNCFERKAGDSIQCLPIFCLVTCLSWSRSRMCHYSLQVPQEELPLEQMAALGSMLHSWCGISTGAAVHSSGITWKRKWYPEGREHANMEFSPTVKPGTTFPWLSRQE